MAGLEYELRSVTLASVEVFAFKSGLDRLSDLMRIPMSGKNSERLPNNGVADGEQRNVRSLY
jgi:hypothetical protein